MSSWETFHQLSSQSVAKWTREGNLTIFNIERQPFLSSSEGLENWLGIETQGAIYVFLDHTQLVVTPIQWGFKQRFIYSYIYFLRYFGGFWRYFDWIFDGFLRYCDQWQSKSILGNVRRSSPQNVSSNPHYTNNPHTLILTTNTNYFLNSTINVVVIYNQCTQCNTLWFLT